MRIYIYVYVVLVALALAGCQREEVKKASPTAKHFELIGKVLSVDAAKKTATIQHQDIPGYMQGMTMEFPVRQDEVWPELKPGVDIRADLVVDNANAQFWIENISISAAPTGGQSPLPVNEKFAQVGQDVPDFKLTDQDGKPVKLSDLRYDAVAITFIYSECPLPDYCIRMSKNFSEAAKLIEADPAAKGHARLLSISFDPARDTPAKLKEYGKMYLGGKEDFSVWQLAVGDEKQTRAIADFFGLQYETDANNKAIINHSLVTVVISPLGKVYKIYKGNEWTPEDLVRTMKESLPDVN